MRITLNKDLVMVSSMRIGILGSGLMGVKLGTLSARAGEVVFSYARSEQKLKMLAGGRSLNAFDITIKKGVVNGAN